MADVSELKEGIDFILHLREGRDDENVKIQLTSGPYDGTIFRYQSVEVVYEDPADGDSPINVVFDVEIFEPLPLKEIYEKDGTDGLPEDLQDRFGELLSHFLRKNIENETRTDNIVEPLNE